MDPLEFCRTLAEELNVKKLSFALGVAWQGDRRMDLEIVWQDGGVDLCLDGVPQGKPELAEEITRVYIRAMGDKEKSLR